MKLIIDFEDFLKDEFILDEPMTLDDDFPDAFDNWLAYLDADTWIKHANTYATKMAIYCHKIDPSKKMILKNEKQ